ncbi:MAG: hypothetical protein CSA35_02600 [Dethiosulfovibrio peptidovorans]|nr:MAG: hypothetical protein CSA35_02600 [Dethiosulfovibrio peptidovorans]
MKSGSPASTDNYQQLKDGDVTVWVPDAMDFVDKTVSIDLKGFLWMVNLVVTSAVLAPAESGCEGCTSCH